MNIKEGFSAEDGMGAALICARCKQAVRSGESHECGRKKVLYSSGTASFTVADWKKENENAKG